MNDDCGLRIGTLGLWICGVGAGINKKCRKMLGDSRLAGVRQAKFAQAGSSFARGQFVRRGEREEPADERFLDLLACELGVERSTDYRPPGA